MKSIPKELDICGIKTPVQFIPNLATTRGNVGEYSPPLAEIHIDSSLVADMQRAVLIHEIIEALCYHLGLSLEHDKLTALATGIDDTFKRNNLYK